MADCRYPGATTCWQLRLGGFTISRVAICGSKSPTLDICCESRQTVLLGFELSARIGPVPTGPFEHYKSRRFPAESPTDLVPKDQAPQNPWRFISALPADHIVRKASLGRRFEVGELGVEQLCQGLGMALVDGEDDGLAEQRLAQHALGIDITLCEHLSVFAHDGAARADQSSSLRLTSKPPSAAVFTICAL